MDGNRFLFLARKTVIAIENELLMNEYCTIDDDTIYDGPDSPSADDVFVVWSSKVLQNNKAMLGISGYTGVYYEITYDGNTNKLYVDRYIKERNLSFTVDKDPASLV